MRSFLEENGLTVLYVLLAVVMIAALMQFTMHDNFFIDEIPEEHSITAAGPRFTNGTPPVIEVDSLIYVRKGDVFNPFLFLKSAKDCEGHDLSEQVMIYGKNGLFEEGEIDTDVTGKHRIRYAVQDARGLWAWTDCTVEVRN